jgi:large subunit ribosomal protein L10
MDENERRYRMPNTEKIEAVAELAEQFSSSSAAVITEYRGLTVAQLRDLRRALGRDTTYAVVKNTLTKRAASDAGVAIEDSLLTGPTAIAFVKGDAVEAAKGLRDFARTHPLLVIKGGVLDGNALTASELARIADLESREVLLAKLAGALKALPTRAAGLFQAPLSQVARLAKALEEKKPAADVAEAAAPEVAASEGAASEGAASEVDVPEVDAQYAENVDTADPDPVGEAVDEAIAAENAPPAEPAE